MRAVPAAAAAVVIWFAVASSVRGQTFPTAPVRSFSEMRTAVRRDDAPFSQQVQLQWFPPIGAAQTAARPEDVRILSRARRNGPLPRERDPQLTADRLVIVSSDAAGRELDWRIVVDPRLIRAETPDGSGRLTTRLLQRTDVNLLIDVPDDDAIVRLRVYAAEWTGDGFALRLIATADLQ